MTEQKRIPILVDTKIYEQLRKLAYVSHVSMSEHIRQAIKSYLEFVMEKEDV